MKKLLLSFCLTAMSIMAFAQLPTIGIRGGVNFAKLQISADNSNISIATGSLTTYSVGAFIDFKFGSWSIQPALNYTGKGGSITGDDNAAGKFDLHYLQVPVNLVYHVPVLIGNIYFGAGPYLAYGVSGKETVSDGTTTQTQNVTFGGNGDFLKTDAGINAIAGIQFKTGLLIHLNYDFGLANVANDGSGNATTNGTVKTNTFGVSVGYAF